MKALRSFGLAMAAILACALFVAPVSAQSTSPGYDFLKGVKDRDGDKVTAALDKPGNTLINARDISTGETALLIVVQRRDTTWLRFLLGHGADPNIADNRGLTPLQLAANLGYQDGVAILTKSGADVDKTDSTGETPLMFAVHRHDLPMIRTLLDAGADPDRSDNSGRSARDYAKLMGTGSEIVLDEMDKAADKLKAKAAGSYGPGA
ncbi:ankyrin repeat domain-containing protein [Qipengyuania algicida]